MSLTIESSGAEIPASSPTTAVASKPPPPPASTSSGSSAAATAAATTTTSGKLSVDKVGIYKHPLFPLLAILFEKCEKCTMQPDCPDAKTADKEIINFIKTTNRKSSSSTSPSSSCKRFFTADEELDDFMTKAVQVLRIHLMELEKVNELCQDFCSRYIHCLKGKMQSENLLRGPDENLPLGLSQVRSSRCTFMIAG